MLYTFLRILFVIFPDNPHPPVIADQNQPPVVHKCPTDIYATVPYGTQQAIVEWQEPKAYSPADPPNLPITVTKTNEPSSIFYTTTFYTVEYTFTDSTGLWSTCSFDIYLRRKCPNFDILTSM